MKLKLKGSQSSMLFKKQLSIQNVECLPLVDVPNQCPGPIRDQCAPTLARLQIFSFKLHLNAWHTALFEAMLQTLQEDARE